MQVSQYEIGQVSKKSKDFFKVVRKLDLKKQVNIVLDEKPKTITRAIHEGKENEITGEIALVILELNSFYGQSLQMGEDMVWQIAEMIVAEYPHYNIYDIGLCCQMGKVGKFGKMYGQLNGGAVMDWFSQYEKQRLDSIIHKRQDQKTQSEWGSTQRNSGRLIDLIKDR